MTFSVAADGSPLTRRLAWAPWASEFWAGYAGSKRWSPWRTFSCHPTVASQTMWVHCVVETCRLLRQVAGPGTGLAGSVARFR